MSGYVETTLKCDSSIEAIPTSGLGEVIKSATPTSTPNYGTNVQYSKPGDKSPELSKEGTAYIQQVMGKFCIMAKQLISPCSQRSARRYPSVMCVREDDHQI